MIQDIVCGMGIEEDDSTTLVKTFLGRSFFFCSGECLLLFSKEPAYFISRTFNDDEVAIDFVCGMSVEKNNSPYIHEYKGITFYFCSFACKEQFENNPQQFVGS